MRSMSPSHRRIATAITAIGFALGSGLCLSACGGVNASATPGTSASATPTTSPEAAHSLAGFPGTLLYLTDDDVVRRDLSGSLVPTEHGTVSPDGTRAAEITENGDVMVTDGVGQTPRRIYRHAALMGYGPAWSPDGRTLIIGRQVSEEDVRPGLLDVATGRFTEAPGLKPGLQPLFSGDGRRIAFVDECRLFVANADGSGRTVVPVVGDENRKNNPAGASTCDVVSVNLDGTRLAVNLKGPDEPSGDIAGDIAANTVIDTATGAAVALPISGEILAVLYRPDGTLVVRSRKGGTTTLTALSATGEQIAQVVEPTDLRKLDLSVWTH
jgi:TolB protein